MLSSVLSFQAEGSPLIFLNRTGLPLMKSFSFCSFENVSIFPAFLKDNFAEYRIVGC